MPNVNLISNIGFGVDATHTTVGGEFANMILAEIQFPLKHPVVIFSSRTLDSLFYKRSIQPTLNQRVINRLNKIFHR